MAQQKAFKNKYMIAAIVTMIIVAIVACIGAYGCILISGDKAIDGVTVNGADMSSKTKNQIAEQLEQHLNIENNSEIEFICEGESFFVNTAEINLLPDIQKTADNVYNTGRGKNIFSRIIEGYKTKFFGKDIPVVYTLDNDILMSLLNERFSKKIVPTVPYSVEIGNDKITVTNSTPGKEIANSELIAPMILEDFGYSKTFKAINLSIADVPMEQIDIEEFFEKHLTTAKDATYEEQDGSYSFTPEVIGVDFDRQSAKEIIEKNRNSTQPYEIPATITQPDVTVKDLQAKFATHIIASASTSYASSDYNRASNVALAASKINGYVLNPGDRFSFNTVVGPRTKATGFKVAHVYEGDKVVDGMGGGICQVSSTLYNAVVKADLKIVYRLNHSMPVAYVRPGTDATVSYGTIDFVFENNKSYPVTIAATTYNRVLTISVKGANDGDGTQIEISTQTIGYTPFSTKEIKDDTMDEGTTKVVKQGTNGSIVNSYKIYKKDGKVVKSEFLAKSVYIPVSKVVHIGAKKKTEEKPSSQPEAQPEVTPEAAPESKPDEDNELQSEQQIPSEPEAEVQPDEEVTAEVTEKEQNENSQSVSKPVEQSGITDNSKTENIDTNQ